jgi:molybdenum cofactor guanylyltransferase
MSPRDLHTGARSKLCLGGEVSAFLLAGGHSTRMGRDKALLPLAGRPLIAHALALLAEAGLPATILGNRPDLRSFAPVLDDAEPDHGPLAGICAALASTSARDALFLSVDQPLLPASLLIYLLHHACATASAVTVASVNGVVQTFPAVLDRSILPLLQQELAARHLGCLAAFRSVAAAAHQPFSAVPVEYLAQSGQAAHPTGLPAARWLFNLNTPADLDRAHRLIQSPDRRIA